MRILPNMIGAGLIAFALSACGSPEDQRANVSNARDDLRSSFFDLFRDQGEDRRIGVNKFLWSAALDTLSVLPIEQADPFSGVIATDWGRVNGAAQPYRVTVYITQPALEARSLRVAAFRQVGGRAVAVSDETAEEIENAILTRARQLRVGETQRRNN